MIATRAHPSAKAGHPPDNSFAELINATKRYGDVLALDKVNLQIRPGEVVAMLGPNGAGKTTSVSLMLGLVQPTAGKALLFGRNPQNAASRMRAGAMLQISGLPATLKVREHITLFSSYYPNPLPLPEVLELAGLQEVADRPYGKLSGGQKQRLHFALALCGNPDILFLDEPTVGLDVESRRAFWERIREFIGSGRTVVLTTHYIEEADALADRVVVINHGHIIAEGTPAEIKSRTAATRIRCVTKLSLEEISHLPGVTSTRREGAALELLAPRAEPVVLELLTRDPSLHDLEVSGAGLEEAFLALTDDHQTTSQQGGSA